MPDNEQAGRWPGNTRISDRFATLFIAGCLAIRFNILPFTEAELLDALLTCERDHVAFIDRELRNDPTRATSAHGAAAAIAKQTAIAGVPATAERPFDRLKIATGEVASTTSAKAAAANVARHYPKANRS